MSDVESEVSPLFGREQPVPRKRWRWLLPLLVGLAVASLVGVGLTAALRDGPASPGKVIDRYLDAVESGDTTKAYGFLCDGFRAAKPFSEFQRTIMVEKFEAGGVTEHGKALVKEVGRDRRIASYTVRRPRDGDVFVDAALVRERGQWRVCGFKTRGPAK